MMRHVSFVKLWVEPEQDTPEPNSVSAEIETDDASQQDSRPQRTRRLPTHLTDFVTQTDSAIKGQNNSRHMS